MNELNPPKGVIGLAIRWMAVFALIVVVALVIAYALGWFAKPMEVMGPDNIQRMSRQANDAWQALEAKQASIDAIETKAGQMVLAYGEDMTVWPQGKRDEYLQLQAQATNLSTSYNSQCGQYNAMWADEWRSVPAPNDLPTHCEMR